MKKLLLASALIAASSSAFAAKDAGCGLGSLLFQEKEGLPYNVMAATTNGVFGNQTFGMTSGTLGCGNSGSAQAAVDQYLDSNIDKIAFDMSRGQGETLQGLAAVMGVDSADQAHFFAVSKNNFDAIFPSADVSRADVVAQLRDVMSQDATLAKYVL